MIYSKQLIYSYLILVSQRTPSVAIGFLGEQAKVPVPRSCYSLAVHASQKALLRPNSLT